METRVAVISIIVENPDSVSRVNALLHQFCDVIIGRMGIPYPKRGINLISVAMDASQDRINSLCGSLGKLDGITAKATYSKVGYEE